MILNINTNRISGDKKGLQELLKTLKTMLELGSNNVRIPAQPYKNGPKETTTITLEE